MSSAPGAGLADDHWQRRRAGTSPLFTGAPSFSHGRAAAATSTVPAAGRCPSTSERWAPSSTRRTRWPRVPYATATTDRSKLTRTGEPAATVSQRPVTCATGVRQRQPQAALASERPADPAGPANDGDHRNLLARRQPHQRRQAPAAHRQRNRPAVGPERARLLELPAEQLHIHPRQRRRIGRHRHARPLQHGGDEPSQRDRHDRTEAPQRQPARAPRRTWTASAREGEDPDPTATKRRIETRSGAEVTASVCAARARLPASRSAHGRHRLVRCQAHHRRLRLPVDPQRSEPLDRGVCA